jgi:hypothetical protein
VSSLIVSGADDVPEKLVEVTDPSSEASFAISWSAGGRERLIAVTDPCAMGESCVIEDAHRRLPSSVDLTALHRLPPRHSLPTAISFLVRDGREGLEASSQACFSIASDSRKRA